MLGIRIARLERTPSSRVRAADSQHVALDHGDSTDDQRVPTVVGMVETLVDHLHIVVA